MPWDRYRPPRTHYRTEAGGKPVCGTKATRPTVSGEADQVTCHACLRVIEKRKREGRVDLFGGAS